MGVKKIKIFLILILLLAISGGQEVRGLSEDSINQFFSDIFTAQRQEEGLVGGVFMVVQEGEIIFLEGSGYQELENDIPVDPGETRFRLGSISKVFTATALMQLVEQGLLDLHTDIREYLPQLEWVGDYEEKVTAWHLLTHTAGLDERMIGTITRDFREIEPLEQFLWETLPPRIQTPGELPQYSNHGLALTALLVEAATGMDFDSYLEQEVFAPLGMESSSPRVREEDLPLLAREYKMDGTDFIPRPLYEFNYPPVGSMIAPASDVARFMIDFLQVEEGIIQEETREEMLREQFQLHPQLPAMGLGFFELNFFGHSFVGHGGDTLGSHSFMLLDREGQQGFFISGTGPGGPALIRDTIEGIVQSFYGEWAGEEPQLMDEPPTGDHLLGSYRNNRYSRHRVERLLTLLQPNLRVAGGEDGNLRMITPEQEVTLYPLEPDLYVNPDEGYLVYFGSDSAGGRDYLQFNFPIIVYEKLKWYENNQLHLSLLGVSLIIMLLGLVFFLPFFLVRRKRKGKPRPFLFHLAGWTSFFQLAWPVILVISGLGLGDIMYLGFGMPPAFHLARIIFFLALLLSGLCAAGIILIWRKKVGNKGLRLLYYGVTAASIVFSLVLIYYRFPVF